MKFLNSAVFLIILSSVACDMPETGAEVFPNTNESFVGCGDGIRVASEECDDGNFNDGDGCSSVCVAEDGEVSQEPCAGDACVVTDSICGDGVVDEGEECDAGDLQQATCNTLGFKAGKLKCGGDCIFDTSECANTLEFCSDLPVAIPDNDPKGVDVVIDIPEAGSVARVEISSLLISHTFLDDLEIFLANKAGQAAQIVGTDLLNIHDLFCGGNNMDVFLSDEFSDTISGSCVPGQNPAVEGSFRPETPFSVFEGADADQSWRLFVMDTAAIDTGTVDEFCLAVTY